jgi:hypothetical protein
MKKISLGEIRRTVRDVIRENEEQRSKSGKLRIRRLVDDLTMQDLEEKYVWVLKADIENAIIGLEYERIKWYSGIWHNRTWKNGTWLDGTFNGETWKDGLWRGGTFAGGTWEGGIWLSGAWDGGTWKRGTWLKGKIWDDELNEYVDSDVDPNEYFKRKRR